MRIGFALLLLAVVLAVEADWYAVVALLTSSGAPRRAHLDHKAWVDRAAGAAMIRLGLRLTVTAAQRA